MFNPQSNSRRSCKVPGKWTVQSWPKLREWSQRAQPRCQRPGQSSWGWFGIPPHWLCHWCQRRGWSCPTRSWRQANRSRCRWVWSWCCCCCLDRSCRHGSGYSSRQMYSSWHHLGSCIVESKVRPHWPMALRTGLQRRAMVQLHLGSRMCWCSLVIRPLCRAKSCQCRWLAMDRSLCMPEEQGRRQLELQRQGKCKSLGRERWRQRRRIASWEKWWGFCLGDIGEYS